MHACSAAKRAKSEPLLELLVAGVVVVIDDDVDEGEEEDVDDVVVIDVDVIDDDVVVDDIVDVVELASAGWRTHKSKRARNAPSKHASC